MYEEIEDMESYLAHRPIGYSYRVDDRIFAGEYPVRDWNQGVRMQQIRHFTGFGITDFIDLTVPGEMPPYQQFLPSGAVRHSFPVPNRGVPESVDAVAALLRKISDILDGSPEARIYIHCHGGVGRTGTIVSCYYVGKGMSGEEAIALMRRRYAIPPGSLRPRLRLRSTSLWSLPAGIHFREPVPRSSGISFRIKYIVATRAMAPPMYPM